MNAALLELGVSVNFVYHN